MESVCREREGVCFEVEDRGSVCNDRERLCGEIERGSVREKRKRRRDRVCAE